jgi:ribosomal protein L11 methyltransferase
VDASPALILRFPSGTTAPLRDRLVATLADHELVAVQEDDLDRPSTWTAHFASREARDAAADAVAADAEFTLVELDRTDVEDDDWARRTQADLPAIRIGRITVAPPWDLPPVVDGGPGDEILVRIEPSRGFGTGHHQSTRLCIVLLQARDIAGRRVIDVGTGSGVLAVTAAKLGAAFVAAIDSDPDAVENARENIAANSVERVVDAHVEDLVTTTLAPADLVLANLTGTLLAQHAADLARLVQRGGALIASGFNIDEKPRVTAALAAHFDITETAEEDDWFAVGAIRSVGP